MLRNELDLELSYIKDDQIRESARILLSLLPEYIFHIPASSTGKYHPISSLGEGGLIRHIKAAVKIGYELLNLEMYQEIFDERERDLIIYALLFHDGLKKGLEEEKYTRFDHPLIMAKFIKDNKDKLLLSDEDINYICDLISSHMGEWNKKDNIVMPKPKTEAQKFVHMCDYLASRKYINIDLENNILGKERLI